MNAEIMAHANNSNLVKKRKEKSTSSKAKRNGIIEPQLRSMQSEVGEISVESSVRDEEIRRRAYEIYLGRCEQPGRDLDDWLRA